MPGTDVSPAERDKVDGDRDFNSSFGPMQRNNPRVYEIMLTYKEQAPIRLKVGAVFNR